ncbi:hypothetical protein BMF94_1003 [Rhodotorula taiwanensis]|uniref:Uncharacterized protein n=1 Tax=Rhodotorula taiwanensis TaxID=741276 RepID=A0A2S5BGL9_9BASI|nr:hypothetical protein BMF94_1003 [Rhodotorula taiwanensis]
MRTYATLAAVPLLAVAVSAAGLIDNMKQFTAISNAAKTFDGDYYVRNVKTGKYLYFDRPDDTTNLITGDEKKTIQLGHDKAYGQSGRKWDTWDGTYFRGLNDKCLSAQWGEHGTDVAGVSYGCKVGEGTTGSDSLELAKQLWRVIPCGVGSGSGSGSGSSDSAATADFRQLATVDTKSDDSKPKAADTADFESPSDGSDAAEAEQPAANESAGPVDPKDRSTWVCRKDGKWLSEHPDYVYEGGKIECKEDLEAYVKEHGKPVDDGIDPNDRTTWECKHDAQWLSEHPDYVWKAGKIECRQRLLDFYAKTGQKKRSYTTAEARAHSRRSAKRHSELAKRGSEETFCIIALDHLTDMTTRALTEKTVASFGGYLSVELADFNKDDDSQHWVVTQA